MKVLNFSFQYIEQYLHFTPKIRYLARPSVKGSRRRQTTDEKLQLMKIAVPLALRKISTSKPCLQLLTASLNTYSECQKTLLISVITEHSDCMLSKLITIRHATCYGLLADK